MGIGSFQGREIRRRQQVEDEPVVALAQDLDWNAARLLRDQQRAQIVLTPFLHPGDVGLCSRCIFVQHRLGLFDDRDRRDRLWIGCGEFLLVPVEDPAQDQARENERLAAAHLRDVNDAQLPLGERVNQHVHKLAALVMQHLHDRRHVASGRQGLGLLPLRIKVEQSADIVKRRGVPGRIDQIDQRLPPVLRKPA